MTKTERTEQLEHVQGQLIDTKATLDHWGRFIQDSINRGRYIMAAEDMKQFIRLTEKLTSLQALAYRLEYDQM